MGAIRWRTVKELLSTAQGLAPSERRSFLATHFPDAAVRQAVEALLDENTTESRVPGAPFDPAAAIFAPDLAPGMRIGPYLLLERIGAGGMGEVFLGSDTRLQRRVALKCLLATVTGDALRAKILHEARAAARVNHPNVAMVHDIIEHDARAFIVMEYVEGESLAARIGRGPFPASSVIAIGRQLASALAAAHARGVVHRDLKPSNVQVRPDGSVKILDFGVAHVMALLSTSLDPRLHQTTDATDRHAGTPPYMAPEQLFGEQVDERCDIFSLGVVLYEMATGRRPFRGSSARALLDAIDEKPSRADVVNPLIPAALASAIELALEFDRGARFQTAEELDRALAQVPALPAPPAPPLDRRRWLLGAVAAVVVVTIAGVAVSYFLRPPPAAPPPRSVQSIAVLPMVNMSSDPKQEYFADALTEGLINTLGRVSALKIIARTSVTPFKRTTKSIAEIAMALGVDAVLEGSAVIAVDVSGRGIARVVVNLIDPTTQTQLWNVAIEREVIDVMSLQNEIVRLLAQGIRVAVTPAEQSRLERGGTVKSEALRLYLLGRDEWNGRTTQHLNAAVVYFKQAIDADPGYAPAYAGLADSYALLAADFGGMPRAAAARGAIASATRALELDPELGEAYASMGFVNRVLHWNWPLAEEQLRRALALNPSYATAHQWYGNLLSDLGREDESLAQMKRALELDPLSAIISRDVAWPLFFARRYDEAIAQLSTTLTRHPGFPSAERLLARTLAQKGSINDAVQRFEAISQRDTGPRARCELAWVYALAGRQKDAEQALAMALASTSPVYPYDLALVYTAMRRPDDAFSALERAFVERDATMLNLKHDPRLDALRTDPRFPALLTRMRFPT